MRKVCDEAFPEGREGDELLKTCPSEQFQCEPGECIYSQFVCDGEPDCSNGLDETNCLKYTSLYMVSHDFNQWFGLTSLSEVCHGFMPPQLKTRLQSIIVIQNISTNFDNRNSTKYFNKLK